MDGVTSSAGTTEIVDESALDTVYAVITEIVTVISPVWTAEDEVVSSSEAPMTSGEDPTVATPAVSVRSGTPAHPPSFPPSPLYLFLLKVTLLGLVLAVTVIGNLLVLVSFATTRKLRSYTNYYLVGLAVADLVSGGVTPALLNLTFILGYWPLGPVICRAFIYLNTVFVHATFLQTFTICVDRYRATSRPLRHLKEKNRRHALNMILPGFLVPAVFWAVVILVLPEYGVFPPPPPYSCHIPFSGNRLFLLASTIFVSWAPILGTTVLSGFIYFQVIRKRSAPRKPTPAGRYLPGPAGPGGASSVPDPPHQESVGGDADCRESGVNAGSTETEARTNTTGAGEEMPPGGASRRSAAAGKHRLACRLSSGSQHYSKPSTSSRRATRTLAYIILVMIISGTPWFFYSIIVHFTSAPRYQAVNWFIGYVIHLSSAVNPFLYAACNPVFKEAFVRILCCRKKKREVSNSRSAPTT